MKCHIAARRILFYVWNFYGDFVGCCGWSAKLPIEFSNIGNLDRNETYVLPITVQSADGIGIGYLQSAKNYYYVFRGASLVNVVCKHYKNRAYPDFNDDAKFNNLSTDYGGIVQGKRISQSAEHLWWVLKAITCCVWVDAVYLLTSCRWLLVAVIWGPVLTWHSKATNGITWQLLSIAAILRYTRGTVKKNMPVM